MKRLTEEEQKTIKAFKKEIKKCPPQNGYSSLSSIKSNFEGSVQTFSGRMIRNIQSNS